MRGTTIEVVRPNAGLDIQWIIDGITDASLNKPYVIELAAGEYDLGTDNIIMQPYVSIRGVGRDATVITSGVSTVTQDGTSAVIVGADNTMISALSIINTGGNNQSFAIYNSGASPWIEDVSATGSGGTINNVGIRNDTSSPSMVNVTAKGSGGSACFGVVNRSNSSPVMTDVIAIATEGTACYAVINQNSSPTMTNVTAEATGTTSNYGVFNSTLTSPVMTNVLAKGSGGTTNYGVYNAVSSDAPLIASSHLEGTDGGMRFQGGDTNVRIINTRIIGGVVNDPTGTQCRDTFDANLGAVSC